MLRPWTGALTGLAAMLILSACETEQTQVTTPPVGTEEGDPVEATAPQSEAQQYSYALGYQIGSGVHQRLQDIDAEAFADAVRDALNGTEPKLSNEQMAAAVQAYGNKQQQAMQEKAAETKQAGDEFLAKNRTEPDVQTTDSGLQYKVIEPGNGETPSADDTVVVHYRGTLLNGEEFDSSYARGEPARFQVGAVIPGWQEALQLMREGATWKVWVPSELAYGEGGAGNKIGANELLVFDIELQSIE